MDKRKAWVSSVLALAIFLGLGGTAYSMYRGQAERLNVLQRETKEKEKQINQLTEQVKNLQAQYEQQQKIVEEVQKKANF